MINPQLTLLARRLVCLATLAAAWLGAQATFGVVPETSFDRASQDAVATPRQGAFFAIIVDDAEAISKWYVKHLGFRHGPVNDLPARRIKMRNLQRDGAWLELIERPDSKDLRKQGVAIGLFKVGFYIDDLPKLHARLTAAGVAVDRMIKMDGQRFFTMRDPAGNRLQLFERRRVAKPAK